MSSGRVGLRLRQAVGIRCSGTKGRALIILKALRIGEFSTWYSGTRWG